MMHQHIDYQHEVSTHVINKRKNLSKKTDKDKKTAASSDGTAGMNPFKPNRSRTAIDIDVVHPAQQGRGNKNSILITETKAMERSRRLMEQQGERKLASVKAREHSNEDQQPSPEGELQNNILQHPALDSQRFDGIDPNLNPEPSLNTDARREYDNEKREQEKEKQLRLGNMPKFGTAPTPHGP
jgi:hypothetical protein